MKWKLESRKLLTNSGAVLAALFACPALALGQIASEAKVSVQLEKLGWYWEDGDPNSFGTVASSLAPLPAGTNKAMMRNAIIADVVSINGKPARGAYVSHGIALRLVNSDSPRNQVHQFVLSVQTPEMRQIGDLFGTFLSAGAAAPGAPPGAGHWAVTGGSGAFAGIRGQGSNAGGSDYHVTLMKEDTAARRANSSGRLKLDFYLSVPAAEVQAAYHSADGRPVTSSSPVAAGEVVILDVKAEWPASPPLEPGQTFAAEPLQVIAIPLEATVNDQPAEVINAVAWPGTRDRYRVDVRIPAADSPEATLILHAGYILPSAPYKVPMRRQ